MVWGLGCPHRRKAWMGHPRSCGLMQREKPASGIEALMDFESFPYGLKPVPFNSSKGFARDPTGT